MQHIVSWRPLQAELVQPTQLPDGVPEVRLRGRKRPVMFALELATYPDRRVAMQAARDALLVWLERDALPEVLAVVLCPKGNVRVAEFFEVESRQGWTNLRLSWRVVELWNLPAESLLAENDVGLVPWVTRTQFHRPAEVVFRECRKRIDQLATPAEHTNLLAVTQVLARLRFDDPRLFALRGGPKAVIESPLLKELHKVAERRGRMEARRADIIRVFQKRFDEAPEAVVASIKSIEDVDRVNELFDIAIVCPDLAFFEEELRKSQ